MTVSFYVHEFFNDLAVTWANQLFFFLKLFYFRL